MQQLTDQHRHILDFEHGTWTRTGTKEADIWATFGHTAARHAQIVGHLIDQPAAMEYAPLLVSRLRRLRDARVAARAG